MYEIIDRIMNYSDADSVFGLLLIFGIGAFMYLSNWWCLMYNNIPKLSHKGRFVSMIPPIGGLLIAIGILLIGGGWLALIGLTDPCIGSFVYSVISETVSGKKRKNKDDRDKDG